MLDEREVVAIVTMRASGAPIATPIWSVTVDDRAYLRSAFGAQSWWYRHVRSGRPVAFAIGDGRIAERDRDAALQLPREPVAASYVGPEEAVQVRIDDQLRAQYAHAPSSSLQAMLSADALACTLRVEPLG